MAERTASLEEVAWAAGLYEGEGSGGVGGMALTMCDEDPVRRFHQIVSVGTVWENNQLTKAGKRSWKWKVGNRRGACYVRDLLWPWLGVRRRQQFIDSEIKYQTHSAHGDKRQTKHKILAHDSTCPNCGYVSTAAGITQHRKRCDREVTI